MANIPTSGTLRVETPDDKAQLIEYLVDKRMKFLEYLRQMHCADPEVGVLWMNTVRIKRADLLNYFNVDSGFVAIATAPPLVGAVGGSAAAGSSGATAKPSGGPSTNGLNPKQQHQIGNATGAQNYASPKNQPSSSAFLASPSSTLPVMHHMINEEASPARQRESATVQVGDQPLSFTAAAAAANPALSSNDKGNSGPSSSTGGSSIAGAALTSTTTEMMGMSDFPPPAALTTKVDPSFIKDHTIYWYLLGSSVAGILQSPKLTSIEVFVEAFTQLLFEIEIFTEKSGSASKMLALRALRNYRNDSLFSYWNDTEETVVDALPPTQPTSQGFNKVLSPWRNCGPQTSQIFFERLCCKCADKAETSGYLKYHFLDIGLAAALSGQAPPAYEAIVPSLCAVLSMAYQRFSHATSDGDEGPKPGVTKKIIQIDKKLKHFFFGALSREIAVLAQGKLVQQANFLRLRVFGAYSHADERTFMPTITPIQRDEDERGVGIVESLSTASSPNVKKTKGSLPPPKLAGAGGTANTYESTYYD